MASILLVVFIVVCSFLVFTHAFFSLSLLIAGESAADQVLLIHRLVPFLDFSVEFIYIFLSSISIEQHI